MELVNFSLAIFYPFFKSFESFFALFPVIIRFNLPPDRRTANPITRRVDTICPQTKLWQVTRPEYGLNTSTIESMCATTIIIYVKHYYLLGHVSQVQAEAVYVVVVAYKVNR